MSVFVLVPGCPLPLVSTSTGSRGGPFVPQSESVGESGRRASRRRRRWRLRNRCECGGCPARGGAVLRETEGKFRGTGGEQCVG